MAAGTSGKGALGPVIRVYGLPVLLTIAAFVVAYQFVEPAPPKALTILTGSESGAYHAAGRRYKAALEANGFEVTVQATKGSAENLDLVRQAEDGTTIAIIQSGMARTAAADGQGEGVGLASLGSLFFEPIWVFSSHEFGDLRDLKGRPIAIGVEGSGSRAAALLLLGANGISSKNARLSDLSGADAASALAADEIDAVFAVGAPTAGHVAALLETPGVSILNFARAESYARRFPELAPLEVPEGLLDLERNLPDRSTMMLAASANLVVRDDLHPALADLLLLTARDLHGDPELLAAAGTFPSAAYADPELSEAAKRFYRDGPSFLHRTLPFWAATLVDRLLIMLLPLLTLMLPLMKIMPPAYRWRIRSRIYRWYKDLRGIEAEGRAAAPGTSAGLLERLEAIDAETSRMAVPLSYSDELYNLRLHIRLLEDRIKDSATNS